MHADLEKLVSAGRIPADFAARLDQFAPGNYVMHQDLGVGKVAAWSLAKSKIKIDFEKIFTIKLYKSKHITVSEVLVIWNPPRRILSSG